MKKTELLFNLISIPVDALALMGAGIIAYQIRYESDSLVGPILFELALPEFILILVKVIPIVLLIFALLGLYSLRGTRKFFFEFNRVTIGLTLAAFLTVVLFFFDQSIFPSRFIILAVWLLSIALVLIGRIILKSIQQALFAKGYGLHRLALINGVGTEAKFIQEILRNHKFGYEVVAELQNNKNLLTELQAAYQKHPFDEIVQTNHNTSAEDNLTLVAFARQNGLQFSFVPNLFEVQRNIIELNNLQGIPIIGLKNTPLDGWGKLIKRISDIIISFICLIITSPLFLILAIAIKLDSKGPVIYSAERCGAQGKNFKFYKLRSMYTHLSVGDKYGKNEARALYLELMKASKENRQGPLSKIKEDPRVTKVGRFLRRSKLDEIPQFWNVFIGDMSMVGPRPHLPDEVEQYRSSNGRILTIKPGIFGFTQIAQFSWPTLPFDEEVRLDTYYIENWSLLLDMQVLVKSLLILFWEKKTDDNY
ncbi:MAG TPA: sugar transferase [Candidatus Doudnabacteria bacterium]|nr:sugar transferase [Candidatus Doudnabacteria bacterium]